MFLRIYRARKKYRPRSKFSTWLFTIANNLALNALRSRQRKPVVPLNVSDSGPLGPDQPSSWSRTAPIRRRTVCSSRNWSPSSSKALEELNERQRMAVILNKFEDMNYAEIAEVMGLTTQAVKSLLSRARTNLRAALQDYIYMDGEPMPRPPDEDE